MRIHLVAPALPPIFDGIGDYSAHLARELVSSAQVTVLTTTAASCDPIDGVRIIPAFDPRQRRSVRKIGQVIAEDRPDWVVLQFNQFSYGKWGLNPWLPLVLRSAVRKTPGCRLAVMFHEDFVPPTTWKFRIMRQWQRWQFKALGHAAHLIFFSIDPWVRKYGNWFPGKPVLHLPVGSNIPKVQISRDEARERLGIKSDQVVLGLFGLVNSGRNAQWIAAAVKVARESKRDVVLLYIGAHVKVVGSVASGLQIIAGGPFPGDEVSRRLAAIDIFLSPLGDGVSTRRGSMMAGLQHGLPTVGTRGWATDDVLAVEHQRSIMLADVNSLDEYKTMVAQLIADGEERERIGKGALTLYEREFAWPRISARMLEALTQVAAAR